METPPPLAADKPLPRRITESPLTYIRTGSEELTADSETKYMFRRKFFSQYVLFPFEEAVAVLNSKSGSTYRRSIYGLLPMMDHEQFDTMGIRQTRQFFSIEQFSGGFSAVPRMDPSAYIQRCYLFRLAKALEPVGLISLQHVVEELLERCRFLRNPSVAWICNPDKLHVLLGSTSHENVAREKRKCMRVINACCGPIDLELNRLTWRPDGTLWAQWDCTRGNIDRLRADIRIGSKGGIVSSPPFAIETLIMAILEKPNRNEFNEIQKLTEEMQQMFKGISISFNSVSRVAQIHDHLELDGIDEIEIALAPSRPVVDDAAHAWYVATTSPSVRRVIGLTCVGVLSGLGLVYAIRRL